jgi:hypothetical protein
LGQTKDYKIDICCFIARSIKEKEQRLIGPESEYYVRLGGHVYLHLQTVVSVNNLFNKTYHPSYSISKEAHHSSTNLTNLKENLEINCI